jgi:hypothetical protein
MAAFGALKIDQVIMHRVPKGIRPVDAPETIEYSEAPIELNPVDKGFIQLRLRETLAGRARPVIEDHEARSEAPDLARGLLATTGDLVADSVTLARALHARQKWVSSIGLVLVRNGASLHQAQRT